MPPLPAFSGGCPRGLVFRRWRIQQSRTFVEARVKWVRDRGLDHAVEKEKHLLPFHALKDLLLRSSSPSLPLSSIADRREELRLPFRAIRFIRIFPSAFLEEIPSSSSTSPPRPHIRPSPDLLRLHDDEQKAYDSCRAETADRLLRLLMLTPSRRLPLRVVDRLRWDIGLPRDYVQSLLPDYPDYFQIVPGHPGGGGLDLELVCYSEDLAVSAMERYAIKTGGYKKSMPLAFPLQFSRGFDMEKKVRKWVEEWQKLPYISPYEDGSHLPPKSDLAEKWMVGVLHEILHLLVPKKTEKDNLILLGEHVGLPPSFRKILVHHPGIFYISNKLKTQTVILREAYRRDLLVEKHPLMGLRYQYIHLMHKGKETIAGCKDRKSKRVVPRPVGDDKDVNEEEDEEDDEEEDDKEEEDKEFSGDFGTDIEDEESDDGDEDYNASQQSHGTMPRAIGFEKTMPMSSSLRASPNEIHLQTRKARRNEMHREPKVGRSLRKSHERGNFPRADGRLSMRRRVPAY